MQTPVTTYNGAAAAEGDGDGDDDDDGGDGDGAQGPHAAHEISNGDAPEQSVLDALSLHPQKTVHSAEVAAAEVLSSGGRRRCGGEGVLFAPEPLPHCVPSV